MPQRTWKDRLPRGRKAVLLGVGALWLAGLFGGALPMWRKAMKLHGEIEKLDAQMAELDHWTVAGLWLAESLERRAPAIDASWGALFPARRGREQLFLDLAAIADKSGVSQFNLVEISSNGLPIDGMGTFLSPDLAAPPPDQAPPGEEAAPDAPAQVELESYRVRARFEGDYEHTAEFIGGLRRIERAVNVHSLMVRPDSGRLSVEMELDVYVGEQTQS